MIDKTTKSLSRSSDSFYADTTSSASLISESRIVTSKSSAVHQQIQSSNLSSLSLYSSEHDITHLSSINEQHLFNLQSMKYVLFDLSTPTNRTHSHQQPYIHNHRIHLTSSAINRQKQQQKIERENLKIFERLQHIRPTRSLKRNELLSNYDRQMGLTDSCFRFSSRSSSASTSEKNHHKQNRSSSTTNSLNNITINSRPSNRLSSVRRPT